MPDATYVGAGMPCAQCGNPLTPGQPHKCGRVGNPYAPSADWKPGQDTFTAQAAGIWDEGFAAGRAAATPDPDEQVEAQIAAYHWGQVHGAAAAASPDERLREALAFYADKGNYTAQNPVGSGAHVWRDMGGRARAALAAADREAPDEGQTFTASVTMGQHREGCDPTKRDRYGLVCWGCADAPPVSDEPVNDPETNT